MNIIWIKSEKYKFVKINVLKIKSIESVKYTAKIRRLDITTYDGELIKIFEKRGDNQFYLYEAFTEFIQIIFIILLKTLWKLEMSKQRVKIFRKA